MQFLRPHELRGAGYREAHDRESAAALAESGPQRPACPDRRNGRSGQPLSRVPPGHPYWGVRVIEVVDEGAAGPDEEVAGVPIVRRLKDLPEIVRHQPTDEVVFAISPQEFPQSGRAPRPLPGHRDHRVPRPRSSPPAVDAPGPRRGGRRRDCLARPHPTTALGARGEAHDGCSRRAGKPGRVPGGLRSVRAPDPPGFPGTRPLLSGPSGAEPTLSVVDRPRSADNPSV
jgi:hypothetical protein